MTHLNQPEASRRGGLNPVRIVAVASFSVLAAIMGSMAVLAALYPSRGPLWETIGLWAGIPVALVALVANWMDRSPRSRRRRNRPNRRRENRRQGRR